jgi:cation transport ATPase
LLTESTGRLVRRGLIVVALAGLALGVIASLAGWSTATQWLWAAGTLPVIVALMISIARDVLAGRVGVDAVALVSMAAALALGQGLAGVVVAVMYAGGTVLEDYAVARAERDLKTLSDRAPRVAHRRIGSAIEDTPIEDVAIGDEVFVRAGEVIFPNEGRHRPPRRSYARRSTL